MAMEKKSASESGVLNPRIFLAFGLCSMGLLLALFSFAQTGAAPRPSSAAAVTPTFAPPVISGIGGTGFEQSIRIDPTNTDRIYTSAPGTASADTSWIWRSLDGGKTFKWVVGAAPFAGKVTTCNGGGDTEMAIDT